MAAIVHNRQMGHWFAPVRPRCWICRLCGRHSYEAARIEECPESLRNCDRA